MAFLPVSASGDARFGYRSKQFGGKLTCLEIQTPQVLFDHLVMEEDGALILVWDVAKDIYPEKMVEDMFDAYLHLLTELATSDATWHEEYLDLVPASQIEHRARVNETTAPTPKGLLHTLFAEQASRHPLKSAVMTSERTLTYQALYENANQIAHRLRRLGILPDTVVAVVMEKGWEQIAALFGILNAGGAYLPIDGHFPEERVHNLLADSETKVVLTQSWIAKKLTWPTNLHLLSVDSDEFSSESREPLDVVQQGDSLAYVLYTSGSTGKPKGVMIEHRNVVNRMMDVMQRFDLRPTDRAIALTALHHDLSIFDIFCMLSILGGSIVLPDAAAIRDPAHWVQRMVDERVTLWNSVPAFLQMMVEYLELVPASGPLPTSLRWVILSGDFIPVNLPDRLRKLLPDVTIISAGGPTETTVWDICYPIEKVDPQWTSIPYGKPMSNAQYHVLDRHLAPCPIWTAGELYIAGVGLGRGYLRNEEQTKARFIVHPRTGQRLYRSGDLGRYLPDGNIEILGRADFQIKLRGYRIEPGEIEMLLNHHPEVSNAFVMAVGEAENKQLVAYIVPAQKQHDTAISKAANPLAEAYLPAGVIVDSTERLAFKLKKAGGRVLSEHEPRIALGEPTSNAKRLSAYTTRQSYRSYSRNPIAFEQVRELLYCLSPIQPEDAPLPKYLYASAGALYPVQTYLHIKPNRVENIPGGTYYYHPGNQELVLLVKDAQIDPMIHTPNNRQAAIEAAFTIFLVGKMSAIAPMYGEWARDFCLLEAGYMSQLLMMQAPQQRLGLCPIGAVKTDAIVPLLRLEHDHLLLHTLIGGDITEQIECKHACGTRQTVSDRLRTYLQTKLPAYMVPTAFVTLDTLPLTANGKVNRRALPAPENQAPLQRSTTPVSTSTSSRSIRALVQRVLKIEHIEANTNLLNLGATSIDMIRIANRIDKEFNFRPDIGRFYSKPTIADLSEAYEQHQREKADVKTTTFSELEEGEI